jgi:hypothetical protein
MWNMRQITTTALALGAVGALVGTLLTAATATGSPGAASDPRARSPHDVDFALKASGFGTRVDGRQLPAGSAPTAFMAVGCATRAGIDKENHEAEVQVPGLGKVSAVKTELWTREVDGVVSSYAQNTIGKVVVAQSSLGRVELSAVTAYARSFHDRSGFHAQTKTDLGGLRFVPSGGAPQQLDLPAPGRPVEIPGLVKITVGVNKKHTDGDGARAQANALVVNKLATGTKVTVGQAKAQVLEGVKHGTFHGFSAGTEARGLDDNLTSGRTPLALMPCQGTDGEVTGKKLASVDLGGTLDVSAVSATHMAVQRPGKSTGWERGSVAGIDIGDGQLVVDAIVGQVSVTRDGGKVTTSFQGSTVGRVTANGDPMEFPDTGVIEVPGVARIERFVKDTSKNGASIVALRVTLLDGSGAVVDLGQARLAIRAR